MLNRFFLVNKLTRLPWNACNVRRIFIEQSGNIPLFNIPGKIFQNIPHKFIFNFFQIYWEYLKGMFLSSLSPMVNVPLDNNFQELVFQCRKSYYKNKKFCAKFVTCLYYIGGISGENLFSLLISFGSNWPFYFIKSFLLVRTIISCQINTFYATFLLFIKSNLLYKYQTI